MQKKQQTGVLVRERPSDDAKSEHNESDELSDICKDMIRAINANDSKMLAELVKEAFQHCEKQPHEEGEHYDDLNEKAAKEQE